LTTFSRAEPPNPRKKEIDGEISGKIETLWGIKMIENLNNAVENFGSSALIYIADNLFK
jgi:hypothetical protein